MSTAMVANHVRTLEERLGVRLLNRTTRKVSLTEAGKLYYDRSAQILAELDEADAAVGELASKPRGTLRLYTYTAIVPFLVPVLNEYMMLYPDVSLDFNIGEAMIDMIDESCDLVIRTTPEDTNLIARKLSPWRHVLVCSPQYLASRPTPEHPSDLNAHNCLHYSPYKFGGLWRFEGLDGESVDVKIEGSLVSNSAEALRQLTIEGRGVYLAPSFLILEDLEAGRLVRIMPHYRGVELSMDALFPNRTFLPSKVRLFIELLVERFSKHQKWMDSQQLSSLPSSSETPFQRRS